jgi:RNA 3'-terminal phosphate cyclase (ATP)
MAQKVKAAARLCARHSPCRCARGSRFGSRNIRAKRPKPGLLRQHLTAVLAAAEVSDARVEGAAPGSQTLTFEPGLPHAGDYRFAIGTAGSCTLVLQTVLPALLQVAQPSIELVLKRHGFYPSGGGELVASIEPCAKLQGLELEARGQRIDSYAEAYIAALPFHIAERELDTVGKLMNWSAEKLHVRGLANDRGPGNVLMLTLHYQNITEVFTGFGERGVTAENVARQVCREVLDYLASGAAVGNYLADQLILPLALAGQGSFTATAPSQHLLTNIAVIQRFLPIAKLAILKEDAHCYRVVVERSSP